MEIRAYRSADCEALAKLFYDTVHTSNAKDYTLEQLNAWATGKMDLKEWDKSLSEHFCVVATDNGEITGFGDIDKTGYLDRLFVHPRHQGKGTAAAICDRLEQAADGNIITCASITARPFFEKRGYKFVKKQQVERHGVLLTNFVMEKQRQLGLPQLETNAEM